MVTKMQNPNNLVSCAVMVGGKEHRCNGNDGFCRYPASTVKIFFSRIYVHHLSIKQFNNKTI
jgi:hypothetical protein